MATKFKMISDEDVKAVRAAKKVLTKIAKKLRRLNSAVDEAFVDSNKDYKSTALANQRMLDEVDALGISSFDDYQLSIRLIPSGAEAKPIVL